VKLKDAYQVQLLAELMYHAFPHHVVVLIVASIPPVIQQCSEHGSG
jgi:hypothetical protein